jgi:hypothetical protein
VCQAEYTARYLCKLEYKRTTVLFCQINMTATHLEWTCSVFSSPLFQLSRTALSRSRISTSQLWSNRSEAIITIITHLYIRNWNTVGWQRRATCCHLYIMYKKHNGNVRDVTSNSVGKTVTCSTFKNTFRPPWPSRRKQRSTHIPPIKNPDISQKF